MEKKSKFSHLLTVMAEVADPSPPTVSLTIKYPLLMTPSLRQVVKKNEFFTVRLTVSIYPLLPPSYSQLFLNFFMYLEMDFRPEKSFSSNYKNSQLLLTAAAALSQNGQIVV